MDENSVLFAAGNTVEILNLATQEQTHIRTTGGGGIGAVAVSLLIFKSNKQSLSLRCGKY